MEQDMLRWNRRLVALDELMILARTHQIPFEDPETVVRRGLQT
jgi:hypothetical protein